MPFFTYASEERFKDLFTALRDDARLDSTYLILMVLSTVLATVGLYLNSSSVIIGAMLLAPLMAPIIALAMSLLRYGQEAVPAIPVENWHRHCAGVDDLTAVHVCGAVPAVHC